MYPSERRRLDAAQYSVLWQLWSAIGDRHQMGVLGRGAFIEIVALKTSQTPSYRSEYHNAIALVESALHDPTSLAAKLDEIESSQDPTTPSGHARNFVVNEFVRLHVSSGGFASFGFSNYAGYPGGPLHYRKFAGTR